MEHELIKKYKNDPKYISLSTIEKAYGLEITHLPYALRILLENAVRNDISNNVNPEKSIKAFADWLKSGTSASKVNFMPARILMQDFTGVPAIVDLAAMRDAVMEHGGNPKDINLIIPIDLVIDHSIQVDYFKTSDALVKILRWGQQNFDNYFISSCIIVVKNTIFDIK